MASDLISRKALEAEFAGPFVQTYKECRQALREAPAVDAEPVRHGEWLDCENYNDIRQCSRCGLIRNIYKAEGWNYCPNCGAKIDGGKQDG